MEIDLEVVSDEGDNIEEDGGEYPEINCVRLHVPYSMLGNQPGRDYFPLALKIAERLGWTAYDDQSGEPISRNVEAMLSENNDDKISAAARRKS